MEEKKQSEDQDEGSGKKEGGFLVMQRAGKSKTTETCARDKNVGLDRVSLHRVGMLTDAASACVINITLKEH